MIKPESWRCVNDEGMPVHGRPYEKGNLYIRFHLQFPDELDAPTMDALRKLLPPGAAPAAANGRMETDELEQARSFLASTVSLNQCMHEDNYLGSWIGHHGRAGEAAASRRAPSRPPAAVRRAESLSRRLYGKSTASKRYQLC